MHKDSVSAVVLAAGRSSRMDSWKPAAILNGHTVLYYTLQTLSDISDDIIVVGGYNFDKLEILTTEISAELNISVKCVCNNEYDSGMFSSVKTGLTHTLNNDIFITLSDMPFIKKETYLKMLSSKDYSAEVIYPANELSSLIIRKGHPVLIKKPVKERILNSNGDISLRDILKDCKSAIAIVKDEAITFDIDTPEDLLKAKSFFTIKEMN